MSMNKIVRMGPVFSDELEVAIIEFIMENPGLYTKEIANWCRDNNMEEAHVESDRQFDRLGGKPPSVSIQLTDELSKNNISGFICDILELTTQVFET